MPLCLERGFWSVIERFAEYSQRSWSRSGHRTVGPGRWAVGGVGSLDSQRRSSHITFGIYHPDLISGHAGSSSFFPAVSLWHGMNGKMRKKNVYGEEKEVWRSLCLSVRFLSGYYVCPRDPMAFTKEILRAEKGGMVPLVLPLHLRRAASSAGGSHSASWHLHHLIRQGPLQLRRAVNESHDKNGTTLIFSLLGPSGFGQDLSRALISWASQRRQLIRNPKRNPPKTACAWIP